MYSRTRANNSGSECKLRTLTNKNVSKFGTRQNPRGVAWASLVQGYNGTVAGVSGGMDVYE